MITVDSKAHIDGKELWTTEKYPYQGFPVIITLFTPYTQSPNTMEEGFDIAKL
jgi:hypothetical protein